jgi:phosphoglycerate dehydrogenase-like enzyme
MMIVKFLMLDDEQQTALTSADWDAGDIAGAALGVYDEEPLPVGHPRRRLRALEHN